MEYLPLPALAAAAFLVLAYFWRVSRRVRRDLPYTKRPSLLTPAELRFYRVLLRAVPVALAVMAKVRLMDVVSVPDRAWQQ